MCNVGMTFLTNILAVRLSLNRRFQLVWKDGILAKKVETLINSLYVLDRELLI